MSNTLFTFDELSEQQLDELVGLIHDDSSGRGEGDTYTVGEDVEITVHIVDCVNPWTAFLYPMNGYIEADTFSFMFSINGSDDVYAADYLALNGLDKEHALLVSPQPEDIRVHYRASSEHPHLCELCGALTTIEVANTEDPNV